MRSLSLFLIILILFPIAAEKKPKHLKSRIYFYKNVSEDELIGWEKNFFKDHFKEEPMSFPDADILTDNEIDDHNPAPLIIKIKRKAVQRVRSNLIKKLQEPETVHDDHIEIPEIDRIESPEINKTEKPDNEILSAKPQKKNKTPDEISEIPDNEVDTDQGIRKMKKLLKKRKGKRRIDKRRIF